MNDPSAVTPVRPLRGQEDTPSADFTLTNRHRVLQHETVGRLRMHNRRHVSQQDHSSHTASQVEPPLVRELRHVIAEFQGKNAAYERQIKELRGVIVALMEPDMPRILRTPGGIMVLDKK